jgi:hypothetical protein
MGEEYPQKELIERNNGRFFRFILRERFYLNFCSTPIWLYGTIFNILDQAGNGLPFSLHMFLPLHGP